MGYSEQAIRKGMTAEYLAKAFFSKRGFNILSSDTHEKPYDFLIELDGEIKKVQVKATTTAFNYLIRIRNKHGSNNSSYKTTDYDILAGVDVENSVIYLFRSEDVNDIEYGETISVKRTDGKHLSNHKRPIPYYEGTI